MPPVPGQKKRVEEFQSRLLSAKKNHEKYKGLWRAYDKVYHGDSTLPKTQDKDLRSKILVPYAWQQIETIIPRLVDPEPTFDFQPVEPGDQNLSDILNILTRWQLHSALFVKHQRSWIEDALVKGLAVAKILWRKEEKTLLVRQKPVMGQFGLEAVEPKRETAVVVNRPEIHYIDPEDFFWDPSCTNDKDWRYVFHRVWLTKAELEARQRAGVYKNVKDVKAPGESEHGPRGYGESQEEANSRRAEKFAVYEMHEDGRIMAMCGDTLLRDDEREEYHQDIPFAAFSTQPQSRSLVGVSEVAKIAPLQVAMWTTDNQRFDAVSLAMNMVVIADPSIEGIKNLTLEPGEKILAGHHQRVEQLRFDANTAPSMEMTDSLAGWMQQVTGASPFLSGPDAMQGAPHDTATGSSILDEHHSNRMKLKKMEFRIFEATLAKLMVQLDHQYLSHAEIKRIVGSAGDAYEAPHPTDIPMFLDVIPRGLEESLSKSTERNERNEAAAQLGGMHLAPMGDGQVFTMRPVIEAQLESYGLNPVDHFVDEPPPMMDEGDEGIM